MRRAIVSLSLLLTTLGLAPLAQAGNVDGYLGRWDLTLVAPDREYPSWIEVSKPDGKLQVRMVGRWGHARVLPQAEFFGAGIRFVSPKEEEGRNDDMKFELRSVGDGKVAGETTGPDGTVWKIHGQRAPSLERKGTPAWGIPITMFNGKDLTGWHSADPKAEPITWTIENGTLVSNGMGVELVTDQKFDDFKLHIEFHVTPSSNSGIYLRGRYEVQVEDDSHPEAAERSLGGVYGFLAPSPMPAHTSNHWRTYDVTLVGRRVTIVLDGVKVVDNQEIPGITGGALDSHEGLPGPLYLQGSENGRVAYRNIVITPAVKK